MSGLKRDDTVELYEVPKNLRGLQGTVVAVEGDRVVVDVKLRTYDLRARLRRDQVRKV